MAVKTLKRESLLPAPYLGGGATLFHVKDPAGLLVEPHHHLYHEFDFALEGSGAYGIAGKNVPVGKGDLIYIAPGVYHRRHSDLGSPLSLCNLIIDDASLRGSSACEGPWPWWRVWGSSSPLPVQAAELVGYLLSIMKDRERKLGQSQLRRAAPLLRDLLSAYGGVSACSPGLAALAKRIRTRPWQRVSLDEEAERLGVGRHWLSRLFSRVFGVSMIEYRDFARVALAMEELKGGRRGVEALGRELGYSGKPQFIGVFKKLCGMTPSAFRKLHAN